MEKLLPWGIGAAVLALVWFANRSSNGPGGDGGTGPAPAPMVEWIMQKAIHLDRNDAQALWLVTVRHVPDGETGGVNNRLLMLSLAWQESAWRFDVTGDDGKSVGLYQMQESALEDVRRFWKSSFPVDPARLTDPEYATEAAWGFLQVNLKSGRANADLELALTMHNTGPTRRDLAESRRWWGRQVIDRALKWEEEAPL